MNTIINGLRVLRGLQNDKVFCALTNYCSCGEELKGAAFNDLLYEIFNAKAESGVAEYIGRLILTDDNAFSRCCAERRPVSEYLSKATESDLTAINQMLASVKEYGQFHTGEMIDIFAGNAQAILNRLKNFYEQNGYGIFIESKAFAYEDGEFIPLTNTTKITLEGLKNYKDEKAVIIDNILNFLNGLPYSHMLLYGDKGTGKSSTIHAVVNKFFREKLRLIEIGKNNIASIPAIKKKLSDNPLKFILFLDDLSLDERNDDVSTLKTIFEGSFSNTYGNVMLVATSNRRHIVKENFSDRQNSVHPSDSMDEQLSLADRFALTVMFSTTDKREYLSIIEQLAADAKLKTDKEQLNALAERWALVKGGRSPRRAKQFIDYAFSCEKSNRPIDF